jgi:outer membrane protein assembly factor BamB
VIILNLAILLLLAPGFPDKTPDNWPTFRGPEHSGVADNQKLPAQWDAATGANIRWKTAIPGLAHSSPIVWGDRIFVTTAVSSRLDVKFRPGLYGDGDASDDHSSQQWKVYAIDKKSGKIIWDRVAFEGEPREKRHVKSTYASATPATDGRYVVAWFGSQGICAYDMDGKLAWKKDIGRLNVGAYDDKSYEWGTASSPIIYKDMVIIQVDTQEQCYVMAMNIKTGEQIWKTARTELPSWSTPPIIPGKSGVELVTNAPRAIRGYDPETGKELWSLKPSSNITAPTPIYSGDLMIVGSGRRPEKPLYAIRTGARGDISLKPDEKSNASVVWQHIGAGPYMPTPLIYQGLVYSLENQGVLTCYDLATGEEKYKERIPHQGSGFSGSPVESDGRIFLPSEDGDIFVVRAGPKFELLGNNHMGELLMTTPAISGGLMLIKAEHDLFAVGSK